MSLKFHTVIACVLILLFSSCSSETKKDNVENTNVTPSTTTALKTSKLSTDKVKKKGYDIGNVVRDFELENIDGSMVSFASFGPSIKGITVVFTCNSCPYAVMYEDRLVEISERAKKAGYPMLAIMPNDLDIKPNDNLEAMKKRAQEKGFKFPYVIDKKQEIFPMFGATKTPEVYILNKTDKGFVVAYHGAIDDNHEDPKAVKVNYIDNALKYLREGKKIDPTRTKAIGCSIKVKKEK